MSNVLKNFKKKFFAQSPKKCPILNSSKKVAQYVEAKNLEKSKFLVGTIDEGSIRKLWCSKYL